MLFFLLLEFWLYYIRYLYNYNAQYRGKFCKKNKIANSSCCRLEYYRFLCFRAEICLPARGLFSSKSTCDVSMPIYRHKLKFCGHEMIDSFVFGVDKSIPIIISDEFKAHLDDMFKLESGNEYLWLNKVARETRE